MFIAPLSVAFTVIYWKTNEILSAVGLHGALVRFTTGKNRKSLEKTRVYPADLIAK